MKHEHVQIAVIDANPLGSEKVPAQALGEDKWQLLRSPLYATQVAAGDIIQVINSELGTFNVVKRGGNVCVQFYLSENESNNPETTERVKKLIEAQIIPIGGKVDATTNGLISCTLNVAIGFPDIETIFNGLLEKYPGAEWQFTNVYDAVTGEPLGWWE